MSPIKILLAEDDEDDREMFSSFLSTRSDAELFALAKNGIEVIDLMEDLMTTNNLPDLIILDQNMPKQNGVQTLRILKERALFSNIPVFVYSTYADKTLEELSTSFGAVSVFTKPYTFEGYDKMLDNMMRCR